MENQAVVLEESVNKIVVATNIFFPAKGVVQLTDASGIVIEGEIKNPEILKSLISSFGVTPWENVSPQVVVKKDAKGLYNLKLATQIESARLPKLV